MKTSEIISLISLCFSGILFITTIIAFSKNVTKERVDEGEKSAKIEGKIDYIKIQTELITVQSKEISKKLDSQNDRLIVVEQTVQNAHINEIPTSIARLEESVKSAHKRIGEIDEELNKIKGY